MVAVLLGGVSAGRSAPAAVGGVVGEAEVKKEVPKNGKAPAAPEVKKEVAKPEVKKEDPKPEVKKDAAKPEGKAEPAKVEEKPAEVATEIGEEVSEEQEEKVAVAKPVSGDPVQVYGWRETVLLEGVKEPLRAKLDTGALTSSVHAEQKEMFERDGKKWVRFIMTDPTAEKPMRRQIEAPLVRIAKIKEPGGESVAREVVKLSFQIGDRKLRGDFSLNNRSNMLAPVLLGRSIIKELGWVDPSRTNLADEKIFR